MTFDFCPLFFRDDVEHGVVSTEQTQRLQNQTADEAPLRIPEVDVGTGARLGPRARLEQRGVERTSRADIPT